jgi:multidrug efflux pump subunit AcrA (membrane-fusion protein)
VALKVSVDENAALENGATVTLAFSQTKNVSEAPTQISVPLSALKMTGTGPVVFFVTPELTLSAQTVVLGAIRGESVVIKSGITALDAIVVDARGLKDGQAVTIASN